VPEMKRELIEMFIITRRDLIERWMKLGI